MALTNFSLTPFLIGLFAIAGIMAVLQMLRVRHQRVDVVTTMFWKEAIEESRARVLLKRFRHPWAYVLVLLIASMLWWALAEPKSKDTNQREYVVLLDGSAPMLAGDRYARAVKALSDQVGRLPMNHRRVFWCGGDHRLLLDRGEETIVLSKRLQGHQPEAGPASVDRFLVNHLNDCEKETAVYVFGQAPVTTAVQGTLPETVTVRRVVDRRDVDDVPLNNVGIVAIGIGEAHSGRYDTVDVYVRIESSGSVVPGSLMLDLDGEPWIAAGTDLGDQAWAWRDLPANGQVITVRLLGADALNIDNEAQVTLPLREPIKVQVTASFRELLGPILAVDPSVNLVDRDPDVVLGEEAPVPSLQFVDRDAQDEAFVLSDQWPTAEAQLAMEEAFHELGIDQIDATSLATSLSATIRLGVDESDIRQVRVWRDLFSKEYNLVQSSAFPLFIAKTVRWLADKPELVPYLAVGELSANLKTAGASFAPPRTGTYETASGESIMASLVTPLVADPSEDNLETVLAMASAGSERSWMTWLVLLALVLLLLEWGFFQKGQMP